MPSLRSSLGLNLAYQMWAVALRVRTQANQSGLMCSALVPSSFSWLCSGASEGSLEGGRLRVTLDMASVLRSQYGLEPRGQTVVA